MRFRITPSEFAALERGETVGEELRLPGGWRAFVAPFAGETSFVFEGGEFRVLLGENDRKLLAQPDREGVYFQSENFRYFIEKDFPCAHPRASDALEPTTETFAPPPGFEERKNS